MDDAILQLTAGGIFVVLVLRLVFDFLKEWRKGKEDKDAETSPKIDRVLGIVKNNRAWQEEHGKQIADLYDWHNVTDPDTGAKRWYVQRSLEDAIKQNVQNTKMLGEILRDIKEILNVLKSEIHEVRRDVEGLKKTKN